MSPEITIETVPSHIVAGIEFSTTMETLPADMSSVIDTLLAETADSAITVLGPVMAVYTDEMRADGPWNCEVCVPVANGLIDHPVLTTHELAGGRVATVTHTGPYDGLKTTYSAIFGWFTEHGHTYAGAPREIYLNAPGEVDDAELLTRIEFPVVPAAG
ncbi:GyrI-like domain-containing protein [Salinibacterium sp. NSLL150]|uniref:GyrI-like domain-containing protein n=1 Tax=unclassified Salinibacterium TaxID=2632331 RepID=UPI0018CF0448|nr:MULTISPECIES: GyrI-like domain-containing protein [unclassified Salinibacterium]MBH0099560.1 GyrI-like domain-containing protein [Salinibacterium sp. NSLL35]MBH0102314.1 GyrI-like domain-containing protein [Salinibacterium sp. NSLL150]MBH0105074.1 GyrI-like domain-containing protein [Salinibacterium sp. NSLL16]MBH0107834.1 GyrI-like domain-containing protein [Salinibacterium sp. NSLL17]